MQCQSGGIRFSHWVDVLWKCIHRCAKSIRSCTLLQAWLMHLFILSSWTLVVGLESHKLLDEEGMNYSRNYYLLLRSRMPVSSNIHADTCINALFAFLAVTSKNCRPERPIHWVGCSRPDYFPPLSLFFYCCHSAPCVLPG